VLHAINTTPLGVVTYTDTMSTVMPDVSVTTLPTTATFSWSEYPTGANSIDYRVHAREDWAGALTIGITNTAWPFLTVTTAGVLTPGTTYWWQARVSTPVLGPWTANTASFVTPLATPVIQVQLEPDLGEENVSVMPFFSWPASVGATTYEFVIAEDLGRDDPFEIIDAAVTTTINSRMSPITLKYDTVYNWRVRAVSATGVNSAWTIGNFRTEAAPVVVEPEPERYTCPQDGLVFDTQQELIDHYNQYYAPKVRYTCPQDGTVWETQAELVEHYNTYYRELDVPPADPVEVLPPALLWTIIGIGAALVIAVLVLVIRTRRVV
jgi:multisubunit Na+/H+ antiporter MnhC subunit